jgi:hypothetical protein
MPLNESQLDEVERLCNRAIHELVFAVQHSVQDDYEEAADCVVQAQLNCDQVGQMLVDAGKEQA